MWRFGCSVRVREIGSWQPKASSPSSPLTRTAVLGALLAAMRRLSRLRQRVGPRRHNPAEFRVKAMHRLRRINIIGAAGSGVSTLGRALAQRIGGEHFDTDDFCWLSTDPPFRKQREISERLKLLEDALRGSDRWVLSGSLTGWGEALVPLFDLVVFLYVPTEVRLRRLRARERERFGDALDPGGVMYEQIGRASCRERV